MPHLRVGCERTRSRETGAERAEAAPRLYGAREKAFELLLSTVPELALSRAGEVAMLDRGNVMKHRFEQLLHQVSTG